MTVNTRRTDATPLVEKARRLLRALHHTRRTKGAGASARLCATLVAEILLRPITRRQDRLLDQRLGVGTERTTAEPVLDPRVAASAQHQDGVAYSPTPARQLRKILRSLPIRTPSAFTFVDLGCGKGRTLLVAAEHGFGRALGVEFDPELADAARRNAAAYELVAPACAGVIEVVQADAARYEFPVEPVVVFLFNPFGEATLRAVVDRIEETLARWPRPFIVAYYNPMHSDVLDGSITLRATLRNARWTVYAAGLQ
ncbi:class I SAM-dependent methyltransferase [Actinoplanes sp. NPDC049118]|uniref:class I SAM-dependent methyltransferase n=1 Tax=Actinoplanes sp. NPDC049118 TaxID=3155769 RepID=UPI003402646A